jgi:esterase/lipase
MLLLSLLACIRTPRDLPDAWPLPDRLDAFDAWLAESEARYDDIEPGAERLIRWADPARPEKTPVALVYFHGFSATRQEIAPVCEDIAAGLGANVYFARLSGHGRSDDAMAEASLRDWLVEAEEALAIGHAIGDEVVIVGTSTGATLGAWLASRHDDIAASVYLSPNFGPKAAGSRMLIMPGRRILTRLIVGKYREWEPGNEQQARYWTWRYPSTALFPMMELVRLVEKTDLSQNREPTLVIYSPNDDVIDPALVEERLLEMGGQPVASIQIAHGGMESDHVLAGDIVSPMNNALVIDTITDFLVANTAAARQPEPVTEPVTEPPEPQEP